MAKTKKVKEVERTLFGGTIVKINGIPFKLSWPTNVIGTKGNFRLIKELKLRSINALCSKPIQST